MSENELLRRAEDRRRRDRDRALLATAIGLALALAFGVAAKRAAAELTRAGWAVLSLWSLYFTWHVRRWLWPEQPTPAEASLQFYRRELEQRLDYQRHIWLRTGLPICFAGVALVLVPPLLPAVASPRLLLNAGPFFVLLAAWAVMFRRQRRRDREQLEREINDLRLLGNG